MISGHVSSHIKNYYTSSSLLFYSLPCLPAPTIHLCSLRVGFALYLLQTVTSPALYFTICLAMDAIIVHFVHFVHSYTLLLILFPQRAYAACLWVQEHCWKLAHRHPALWLGRSHSPQSAVSWEGRNALAPPSLDMKHGACWAGFVWYSMIIGILLLATILWLPHSGLDCSWLWCASSFW